MPDWPEWINIATGPGGLLVVLILIGWAGMKGKWVFGWQYRESLERNHKLEADRDRFLELAMRGTNAAEAAASVAADRIMHKTVGELSDDELAAEVHRRRTP